MSMPALTAYNIKTPEASEPQELYPVKIKVIYPIIISTL